jgi:hypothetical protein
MLALNSSLPEIISLGVNGKTLIINSFSVEVISQKTATVVLSNVYSKFWELFQS